MQNAPSLQTSFSWQTPPPIHAIMGKRREVKKTRVIMGNFVKEPEDLSGAVMVDVTVLRVCCTLWVWTMTSDGIETREKWPHNLICSLFHILIYFTFVFSYIYITADLWPRLFPCFTLHSVCVCVFSPVIVQFPVGLLICFTLKVVFLRLLRFTAFILDFCLSDYW